MKNKNVTKNDIVKEIMEECNISKGMAKLLIKICRDNKILDTKIIIKEYLSVSK